jgi:hypothetical protein
MTKTFFCHGFRSGIRLRRPHNGYERRNRDMSLTGSSCLEIGCSYKRYLDLRSPTDAPSFLDTKMNATDSISYQIVKLKIQLKHTDIHTGDHGGQCGRGRGVK